MSYFIGFDPRLPGSRVMLCTVPDSSDLGVLLRNQNNVFCIMVGTLEYMIIKKVK